MQIFVLERPRQRSGNDIPSERLHLRKVKVGTEQEAYSQNAARSSERRARSENVADTFGGADRFAVRGSWYGAYGHHLLGHGWNHDRAEVRARSGLGICPASH